MRPDLTPLEKSCGVAFGHDPTTALILRRLQRAQQSSQQVSPFESLVSAVSKAMLPTTYVEFSGGVDSSLVLSAAMEASRRAGLSPPIPVTLRFADVPGAGESQFQRDVIGHLGLREWLVLDVENELDLLGPASCRVLRAEGLAAAARIPAREWMLERLDPNAALLSGEGGDEVLGPAPLAPVHFAGHAFRTRWMRRSAVRWLGSSMTSQLPSRHRVQSELPWLTTKAARESRPLLADTFGRTGLTMKALHRRHRSKRYIVVMLDQVSAQAARFGLRYHAPLLDLEFMAELVHSVPDSQFMNRNLLIMRHFAGVVPDSVLRRTTKAHFTSAVFGTETQAFAKRWDGTGLPDELVDVDAVRRAWTTSLHGGSSLLLQQAWLATEGNR